MALTPSQWTHCPLMYTYFTARHRPRNRPAATTMEPQRDARTIRLAVVEAVDEPLAVRARVDAAPDRKPAPRGSPPGDASELRNDASAS